MIKIVADLHTHTNVSHHAYSSLEEMVNAAKIAGLDAIAITNHAPFILDGANQWHFSNMNIIPRKINGVRVIRGIEMNIMPPNGSLDPIDAIHLKHIDYVIASFHEPCFKPADKETHTQALENVLKNPIVNTLGHLGNQRYDFDHERIISQCNKYGKIIEINNDSFGKRKGSDENCVKIAKMCIKHKVPIVITTDSHISFMVGKAQTAINMLENINFPEELIINANFDRLANYFKISKNIDLYSFEEGKP